MKIAVIATSILLLTAGSALAQTTKQAPPEKMATPSQNAGDGSKYMHRRHLRRTNYATRKYRSRLNCDPIARQTLGVCW